jgi:four helix bundle protein
LGSQIRRSADSVNSNIVEGYGRNRYKFDFIKFLNYSHSSNDETVNHLRKIKVLYPNLKTEAEKLIDEYDEFGKKINKFIVYVEKNWHNKKK